MDAPLQIGEYTVERLLGRGGSGEVYSVRDPARARRIALKLLPRQVMAARPDLGPAFQREYRRLQLLRHPRIVQVYDYGSAECGFYYTMELVDGPDLKRVVPLPWRQTCSLLRDVALSLAIVHSRRLLHRDVGPGNVRCTHDGRAKLLDFGATVSTGIPSSVVGTPPCVPPEALDHEPLDERSDLYGLGALGYFLLTGGHAYPASAFSELSAAWAAPLLPPSARADELPEALDRLILSLLQLDRRLRPGSATEVINHLEALAELPPLPAGEAAQSSFVAPALAGRAAELELLGCSLAAARKGRGGSVLVEATPGLGRTRLLDQFAIDASQRDVLVAPVHPGPASARGHDGCLALCEAILRQVPLRSFELLDEHIAALSELYTRVRQEPAEPAGETRQGSPPPRQLLQSALQATVLGLAERMTVVVLVDDLHACDEPSALLFARLAAGASERRLLVASTRQVGTKVIAPEALQTLSRHARRILLRPLELPGVEALVRSAFVGAPNVKRVAEWAGALADGNPQKIVELLRYLVERGIATFEEGAWMLPERIDASLLPGGVAEALQARLDALSPAAHELAEFVCITAYPVGLHELRRVAAGATEDSVAEDRFLNALDELSAAGVITADERGYVITQRALSDALLKRMDEEHLRAMHLRLGRALYDGLVTRDYDPGASLASAFSRSLAGYHLMRGGERELGARMWIHSARYSLEVDHVATGDGYAWYREAHLLALAAAQDCEMSAHAIAILHTTLVQTAAHGEPQLVSYGERSIDALEAAAGAGEYAACAHIEDPSARSRAALRLAFARFESTAHGERAMNPLEALRLLVGCAFAMSSIYAHTLETRKLAALPRKIAPFAGLSPTTALLGDVMEAALAGAMGRTEHELRLREQARDQLVAIDTGTSTTGLQHLSGYNLHLIASIEAMRNPRRGLRYSEQLEREVPSMQYAAWQVRLLAHIHAGNAAEALACAERLDMAAVQEQTTKSQLFSVGLIYLAEAYALTGDVMGLRATIEQLRPFAERLENWRPLHDAARAQYQRRRGRLDEAKGLARSAASAVAAGEHRGYCFAMRTLIDVLLDCDEPRAALAVQREALARSRAHELGPEAETQLLKLGALAEARVGELKSARALVDAALALARSAEFEGALLGDLHQCAAQIALLESDSARFEAHAALLARHTCAHQHPYMMTRYKGLIADAERAGLGFSALRAGAAAVWRSAELPALALAQFDGATSVRETRQRALELMLSRTGAREGLLFSLVDEELRLVACAGPPAAVGLVEAVAACIAAERGIAPGAAVNTRTATLTSLIRAEDGRIFQTAVLSVVDEVEGRLRITGALAVRVHDEAPAVPGWQELAALASVIR